MKRVREGGEKSTSVRWIGVSWRSWTRELTLVLMSAPLVLADMMTGYLARFRSNPLLHTCWIGPWLLVYICVQGIKSSLAPDVSLESSLHQVGHGGYDLFARRLFRLRISAAGCTSHPLSYLCSKMSLGLFNTTEPPRTTKLQSKHVNEERDWSVIHTHGIPKCWSDGVDCVPILFSFLLLQLPS